MSVTSLKPVVNVAGEQDISFKLEVNATVNEMINDQLFDLVLWSVAFIAIWAR